MRPSTGYRIFRAALAVLLLEWGAAFGAVQSLDWSDPAEGTVLLLDQPHPIAATADSGLPVAFRIVRGPARIAGSELVATNVGTIEVVAEQPGNAEYDPVSLTRIFNRPTIQAGTLPVPSGMENLIGERVVTRGSLAFVAAGWAGVAILDLSQPDTPAWITTVDTAGFADDVAVEGSLMLVADTASIEAYDISNPAEPIHLSTFDRSPFRSDRVALGGGIACVTVTSEPSAEFIDYRNPDQPKSIGSHLLGSISHPAIAARGRFFAIANNRGGVICFDASDPAAIAPVFDDPSVADALAVRIRDDRMVVAIGAGALATFDISNPAAPAAIGRWDAQASPPPGFNGLALGSRWTVTTEWRGEALHFHSPLEAGRYEFLGEVPMPAGNSRVRGVALTDPGEIAIVALQTGGVALFRPQEGLGQTVNFTPPASVPSATRSIALEATASTGRPVAFQLVSGPATLDGDVLNVTGPGLIRVRAVQEGDRQFLPASVERTIVVADPPVILRQPVPIRVAAGQSGVLEVEASLEPPPTFQWYRDGRPLTGANKPTLTAPLGQAQPGMFSVVVSNPAGAVTSRWVTVSSGVEGGGLALRPRGIFHGLTLGHGSGATVRFQRRGRHAWLVNGWESSLRVLNLADPDRPVEVARLDAVSPQARGFDIALVDDVALVTERAAGLGIIDVSNPLEPVRIGNLPLPGSLANAIVVRDRLAYIGNESRLTVVDVDRPRNPVVLGSIPTLGSANGLFVTADRIAAAEWSRGLSVFGIPATGLPLLDGAFPLAGAPAYVGTATAVTGGDSGALYVADSSRGLHLYDVSNPAAIQERARLPGTLWQIQRTGRFLIGADGAGGVRWFDVSDPLRPVSLGSPAHQVAGLGARLDGNRLIHAGRDVRLYDVEFVAMPPVLTGDPEWRRVRPGTDVELEAAVAGSGPFTYRWFHDEAEVGDATGPVLSISGFTDADEGEYRVEVSGADGTVAGLVARLLGPAPPRIVPDSAAVDPDGAFRFRIWTDPGTRVAVMTSADLGTWTEQRTLTTDDSEVEIRDDAPGQKPRFYRIEPR